MEGRPLPKPAREPEQKVVDLREALRLSARQSERKIDKKPKSTRGKMRKAG